MNLQDFGETVGILAGLSSAGAETPQQVGDFLVRGSDGNDAIGVEPGAAGSDGPCCRHENFRRSLGHRPQPGGLKLEKLPVEACVLARQGVLEKSTDDLDGLEHPVDPFGHRRPVGGHDVLVECFTGTEPQPVSVGVHRGHGRGSLSNHRWMPTERRRGHARAEIACSALGDGRQDIPDKGRLSLCGNPRLEVVGGHDAGKTTGFCVRGQCDGF